VPPGPVQVSVKLVVADKAPIVSEPLVARVPLQPPLAVHAVALVDDQVRVEVAPAPMLVGVAESEAAGDGGGATVIVTVFDAVPPGPVQVSVKLVVADNGPVVSDPLVARAPDQSPLVVHAVALVDDQVRVVVAPAAILAGLAESEAVGGGGGTGPVDTISATAEPAVTPVPAAGFWLLTRPASTVALDCCVTVPTTSPAAAIAVLAAACVIFTTLGTATGPIETISATAEPAATLVPAAGVWLITLPAGTVVLDDCEIVPTTRPAPVIAAVAAACV